MIDEQEKTETNPRNLEDFLSTMRERFKVASEQELHLREEAEKDLDFACGDQWEDAVKQARRGRPMMVFNRMHTFIQQVANDARQQRGEVKYIPTEDSDRDTAEIYEGIARHIQYNSHSRVAYETAVDYSAACSYGFYRFLPEYCSNDIETGPDGQIDPSVFDQEIKVLPVHDPLSVYGVLIPACFGKEPQFAFVCENLSKDEFQKEYPNNQPTDWEYEVRRSDGWVTKDIVRVAEYWYITDGKKRTVYQLADGSVTGKLKEGEKAVGTRVVTQKVINFCKTNGVEILENTETVWPGKRIPIFAVLGKGTIRKGKPELFSVIRFQRDPQRLINFYKTRIAEFCSIQPISPFIAARGQIPAEGPMRQAWMDANKGQYSVLEYEPRDVEGRAVAAPQRQMFEPPITGLSEAAAQEIDDMKATAGIYDPSLGSQSNETSGIAIARRQQQSNVTNLHFLDNLERSFDESGKELAAVIPIFYDTPRTVRILGPDETPKIVRINQQFQQGNQVKQYQIGGDGVGKYDIVVTMGRSFSTKRMESFDMMTQVLQTSPNLLPMIGDIFFKNSDLAGSEQLAERFKKMLPPNLQDDQQENDVQAMQQKLAQYQQAVDQLTQELNGAAKEIETKKAEQDAKVSIAQLQENTRLEIVKMQEATKLAVAQINASKDANQTFADQEIKQFQIMNEVAHDAAMQGRQMAHEANMAEAQRQHDASMSQMGHQQALEQQESAQDAETPADEASEGA